MRKSKLLILGFAALFAACSNEEENIISSTDISTTENELNLQTLNYEDFSSLLADVPGSGKSIVLNNGEISPWEIKIYRDEKTTISGLDDAVFFYSRDQDSTSLILSSKYATLRLTRNGQSINYVTYKDKEKMEEIARFYTRQYVANRSSSEINCVSYLYKNTTRTTDHEITGIALNMEKLLSMYQKDYQNLSNDYETPGVTVPQSDYSKLSTRTIPHEPRSVYVVCLLEKGTQLIPHELGWQMEDASAALYDVSKDYITLDFKLLQSDFVVTGNNASEKLADFRQRLKSIEEFAEYSDQMFYLLRYGMWDISTLGKAYVGGYVASNPEGDFWACGISATGAIFPCTLAHEMGHTLGAEHVEDLSDLMARSNEALGRTKLHKNEDNRQSIMNHISWY